MNDLPQRVDVAAVDSTEVELSEQELFKLATGEAVTVSLGGQRGPLTVDLSVTPPVPLSDRE